ncbi:MAG: DUF485 domain-containing protein [Comamonadaceae bacterium]|nr:DUF485 domain-containing protein [Comamonadaceae bacterium]
MRRSARHPHRGNTRRSPADQPPAACISRTTSTSREARMSAAQMATAPALNWAAIDSDPRFQRLHSRKTRFLLGLMIFSVAYYFLLPIGAAYFPDSSRSRCGARSTSGMLFALSEFIVAWGIAFYYSRRANREFDAHGARADRRDAEQHREAKHEPQDRRSTSAPARCRCR